MSIISKFVSGVFSCVQYAGMALAYLQFAVFLSLFGLVFVAVVF